MSNSAASDFAVALAAANRANEELLAGRAAALQACFSHAQDISLFGGFGGHEIGWAQIGPRLEWVAQTFAGGHCTYEPLSQVIGADVALVVQLERGDFQLADRTPPRRLGLRVTMVFRREDGVWRLVHRHADPLLEKAAPR